MGDADPPSIIITYTVLCYSLTNDIYLLNLFTGILIKRTLKKHKDKLNIMISYGDTGNPKITKIGLPKEFLDFDIK